jgi:hypothetical protein
MPEKRYYFIAGMKKFHVYKPDYCKIVSTNINRKTAVCKTGSVKTF